MLPKRSELPRIYGEIVNGYWHDQPIWLVTVYIPNFLLPYWRYNNQPTGKMTVNRDMKVPLQTAFDNINKANLAKEIHSYDGCFAIRQSRTDQRLSVHSYGLAIDLCASSNQLGTKGNMNPALVKCFTDVGFIYGGAWKNPDPMHIQWCSED